MWPFDNPTQEIVANFMASSFSKSIKTHYVPPNCNLDRNTEKRQLLHYRYVRISIIWCGWQKPALDAHNDTYSRTVPQTRYRCPLSNNPEIVSLAARKLSSSWCFNICSAETSASTISPPALAYWKLVEQMKKKIEEVFKPMGTLTPQGQEMRDRWQ